MALRGTCRLLFCANCRLFGSTCPNLMKQSASDSSNLLLTSPNLLWVVKILLKKKKAMQDARFGDGSGFSVFGGYTGEESDDDQPRSRGKSVDFIQAFQASELAAKHSIQVKFEDIDRIVTAGDRVTLVLSHHQ